MDQELRSLIGKYGMKAVHEGIQREMKQTFDYLMTVFHPARNDIVYPYISETIPEPITTPKHTPMEVIVGMSDLTLPAPAFVVTKEQPQPEVQTIEAPVDPNVKEVQITTKGADKFVGQRKFGKEEQKEAVEKKRKELEAQGIKPESLLTKENLEKWIGQGMSYQRIAREFVGIKENDVSAIAKAFGLQSNTSKFIAMRKGQA